jgi:hypothetical protein
METLPAPSNGKLFSYNEGLFSLYTLSSHFLYLPISPLPLLSLCISLFPTFLSLSLYMYSYPLFLFQPPLPPRFSIYIFPRLLPLFTNLFYLYLSLDSSISFLIYLSSFCMFPHLLISTLSSALQHYSGVP